MREIPQEELEKTDLASAEAELSNRVYEASCFIEQLEHAGHAVGNGHHAAQACAGYAVRELRARWSNREEAAAQEVKSPLDWLHGVSCQGKTLERRRDLHAAPVPSTGPGPVRMNAEGWATAPPTP